MDKRPSLSPTYLRLSLTQECQLSCLYCRRDGPHAPGCDALTTEELLKLAEGIVDLCGIRKVRLTGGEPLLHPQVAEVAAAVKRFRTVRYLGLTTNGVRLPELAGELRRAGVDGVNLSLDSLRPETYRRLTRGGSLQQALAGLEAARRHDWRVKINTVLMRGENDGEILDFVRLVEDAPIELRFIEVMPIGRAGSALRRRLVPSARVRAILESAYRLEPLPRPEGAPARLFRARRNGTAATVGVISSVTDRFCSGCNRVRLTARGKLVTCLWGGPTVDLRSYVRQPCREEDFRRALEHSLAKKRPAARPAVAAEMVHIGG